MTHMHIQINTYLCPHCVHGLAHFAFDLPLVVQMLFEVQGSVPFVLKLLFQKCNLLCLAVCLGIEVVAGVLAVTELLAHRVHLLQVFLIVKVHVLGQLLDLFLGCRQLRLQLCHLFFGHCKNNNTV